VEQRVTHNGHLAPPRHHQKRFFDFFAHFCAQAFCATLLFSFHDIIFKKIKIVSKLEDESGCVTQRGTFHGGQMRC
jgi:hypothetical protein